MTMQRVCQFFCAALFAAELQGLKPRCTGDYGMGWRERQYPAGFRQNFAAHIGIGIDGHTVDEHLAVF